MPRSNKLRVFFLARLTATIAILKCTLALVEQNLRIGLRCYCVCIYVGESNMATRSSGLKSLRVKKLGSNLQLFEFMEKMHMAG